MKAKPRLVRRAGVESGGWPEGFPGLLARLYATRGATDVGQAQPRLANLLPPDLLGGIEAAVNLLADAMAAESHIVVVGDFDCAIRTSKTRA